MRQGEIVLGSVITLNDPVVTEALCSAYDFLWIDMEHNPLTLDVVQGHLLAAKGTAVTMLVRVPWNDPVLIKPVLDIGPHGVIVPMVSTVGQRKQIEKLNNPRIDSDRNAPGRSSFTTLSCLRPARRGTGTSSASSRARTWRRKRTCART